MGKLDKYTVKEIHQAIWNSTNIRQAAKRLGVCSKTLMIHLGKFHLGDEILTFENMCLLTPPEASAIWGDRYLQPMEAPNIVLSEYTIEEIHQKILENKNESITKVASLLGVSPNTLMSYLGKFPFEDKVLTFDIMKKLTPAEARAIWGELYSKLTKAPKIELSQYTIQKIHQTIRESKNIYQAAGQLGVCQNTLTSYLGKFRLGGEVLTFDLMKSLTPETAIDTWRDLYSQPMKAPKIELDQYTIQQIHQTIRDSNNITDAASQLGVCAETLMVHLGKFLLGDEELTFELMKSLTPEIASNSFGDRYLQLRKAPKIEPGQYTIEKIHQKILNSKNIREAASRLGIHSNKLISHLRKITLNGKALTVATMKSLSREKAIASWGEFYFQPMTSEPITSSNSTSPKKRKVDVDRDTNSDHEQPQKKIRMSENNQVRLIADPNTHSSTLNNYSSAGQDFFDTPLNPGIPHLSENNQVNIDAIPNSYSSTEQDFVNAYFDPCVPDPSENDQVSMDAYSNNHSSSGSDFFDIDPDPSIFNLCENYQVSMNAYSNNHSSLGSDFFDTNLDPEIPDLMADTNNNPFILNNSIVNNNDHSDIMNGPMENINDVTTDFDNPFNSPISGNKSSFFEPNQNKTQQIIPSKPFGNKKQRT